MSDAMAPFRVWLRHPSDRFRWYLWNAVFRDRVRAEAFADRLPLMWRASGGEAVALPVDETPTSRKRWSGA